MVSDGLNASIKSERGAVFGARAVMPCLMLHSSRNVLEPAEMNHGLLSVNGWLSAVAEKWTERMKLSGVVERAEKATTDHLI